MSLLSYGAGSVGGLLTIYNYMSRNTMVTTGNLFDAVASDILNRTITVVNGTYFGY